MHRGGKLNKSLYKFCMEEKKDELLREWHPAKNGALSPSCLDAFSHKKVWWQCKKGHEWQAAVSARCRGNDCPVCAGKIIISGENDLASMFPGLAKEWHPTKNENLSPDGVSPNSNRKVWWLCEKGHAYTAVISSRSSRLSGCPYCTGKKVLAGFNDLATVNPRLANEWHAALNGTLTPELVTPGSRKKVWWQCPVGHAWKAVISSRGRGYGCPVCAGRFKEERLARYAGIMEEKP